MVRVSTPAVTGESETRLEPDQIAAEAIASRIDASHIVRDLTAKNDALVTRVTAAVRHDLLQMDARTAWALRVNRKTGSSETFYLTLWPDEAVSYVGAMRAFVKQQPYSGGAVESLATDVVVKACEDAISAFYTDQRELIVAGVARQLSVDARAAAVIREGIAGEIEWLEKEIRELTEAKPDRTLILDQTAETVGDFFASAAGQQVLALLTKVMATGAGKMILYKAVSAAVSSAAFKTAAVSALKSAGVSALLKSTMGKALLLALGGGALIPVEAVTAAIVVGIGIWQYRKMPERLADKMPDEVAEILRPRARSIHERVVPEIIKQLAAELERLAVESLRARSADPLELAAAR